VQAMEEDQQAIQNITSNNIKMKRAKAGSGMVLPLLFNTFE